MDRWRRDGRKMRKRKKRVTYREGEKVVTAVGGLESHIIAHEAAPVRGRCIGNLYLSAYLSLVAFPSGWDLKGRVQKHSRSRPSIPKYCGNVMRIWSRDNHRLPNAKCLDNVLKLAFGMQFVESHDRLVC